MSKLPPWSFSMLETFEQCPRRAYHRYILKEKEPSSPALEEGRKVHQALEYRVKNRTPLPRDMAQYEPMAASVERMRGDRQPWTELKIGLTEQLHACGFFEHNVWGRCAIDLLLTHRPAAFILDWKTGKRKEGDPLQLQIQAMFVFKMFPGIDKITACNIWLKDGAPGAAYEFRREHEQAMWAALMPRLQRMEKAMATGLWPEQPSGLCGWCAVKQCQHNRS